ncbi:uncharacterized protein LOC110987841 [Acanthaster planci]|uniref:Uncharacterized protein LOC110987841 n=1 Tax=Acanthaster planci TaxID=133434 RepID=A0A8B7ZMI2_ACAPL|nr:uncharacterized protein LOC110987841 [Acanthaster planci]XP_022106644.1 uncharacterized protein LOC110987841 [Acanthaster planci]
MSRSPLDLSPRGPAVNVAIMSDFLAAPPDLFTVVEGCRRKLRHDPRLVTVCGQSAKFLDSKGGCLAVSNKSELDSITEALLTLPLFFNVFLKRYQKVGNTTVINLGKAAVIVNTQHPHIQDHFKRLLTEAKRLMQRGKRFAVEFNFNKVIEEWMHSAFVSAGLDDADTSCFRRVLYVSMYGRVTVTNHGENVELFTCRDCIKSEGLIVWWVFCFPCCMCVCPIYKLHRALRVTDLGGPVAGVTATAFLPLGEIVGGDWRDWLDVLRTPNRQFALLPLSRAEATVSQGPSVQTMEDSLAAEQLEENRENDNAVLGQ